LTLIGKFAPVFSFLSGTQDLAARDSSSRRLSDEELWDCPQFFQLSSPSGLSPLSPTTPPQFLTRYRTAHEIPPSLTFLFLIRANLNVWWDHPSLFLQRNSLQNSFRTVSESTCIHPPLTPPNNNTSGRVPSPPRFLGGPAFCISCCWRIIRLHT